MSVCVFVLNPTNSCEEIFTFPVANERIYKKCWLRFAENNDLYWFKFFMWGIDVRKSDFPAIIDELKQFQIFMENTSEHAYLENRVYILERIKLFVNKLHEAEFFSEDVTLFIG